MELYGIYFAALVSFNVALALYRHQSDKHVSQHETLALPAGDSKASAMKFKKEFFTWYCLVVAADWLQVRD